MDLVVAGALETEQGMTQSGVNILLFLAGGAILRHVIRSRQPSAWAMCAAFVISGATALGFVASRRDIAFHAQGTTTGHGFWQEMLVGGDAVTHSPYAGVMEKVAGAVVWLLLWALLLSNDDEERGAWPLALLPLLAFGAVVVLGPPGIVPASSVRPIGGCLVALYLMGAFLYWRVRRSQ
jgi:hypothetical protein